MKIIRISAIFLTGFALGVFAMRVRPAGAQLSGVGSIFVKQASIGAYTASTGSMIVGFSCAPNGRGEVECYVATR